MNASPRVLKKTLDICLGVRCIEVDRKRSIGRRELRHPPSFNTRSSRSPNIWKDSEKKYCKDHTEVRLWHALDGIVHDRDSLNRNQ
jgi:hypothetical protein